jgi:hypothetical protein
VSKFDRILAQILEGSADANISFDDLRRLLNRMAFDERVRGSHHIFRKEGIEEMINLQSDGSKAKPYQIRQVPSIIVKYGLKIKR